MACSADVTARPSNVTFGWRDASVAKRFRTAVSLHSHTLYSREPLSFIIEFAARHRVAQAILDGFMRRYRSRHGRDLDFARMWWTPPVSAHEAFQLEQKQIEDQLGLPALVSLTDHDSIEAGQELIGMGGANAVVSVEWTVPFQGTELHLGIHNLNPNTADELFKGMAEYTRRPDQEDLLGLLDCVASDDRTLVVLNHPFWDEGRLGCVRHRTVVHQFLLKCRGLIHALEFNGLRSLAENIEVTQLGEAYGLPVVSGGDRHGKEPNPTLNLTNARSFAAFVSEVRQERRSQVLCMPSYRHSRTVRVLQCLADVLGEHPAHALGQARWSDRVFCHCADGKIRSFAQLWGNRAPAPLAAVVALSRLARGGALRSALRLAFASEELA